MTDSNPSPEQLESRAKQRHFAMALIRFTGVGLVMLGIAAMVGRLPGLEGDVGRYVGFGISIIGLLDFAVVPRLMARRWASPRDPK